MSVRRHLAISSPLVVGLLVLSAGAVLAAAPVDPTAESVAIAAMLQPADVDASATTNGIAVGQPDDFAAYTENGGLREVSQTLFAEGLVEVVYDFRWQFPDAASAKAFLDAAEADLGEVSSGAERQRLPVARRPLPDTRLYRFEDKLFGTGLIGFNYLMRLDNLVAKVYVSEGETTASSEKFAAAIARAAAEHMSAALAGETPSASPILRATPSPSPTPNATPSPSPGVRPTPSPSLAADVAELLSHVPAAIRETCGGDTISADRGGEGELARLTCPTSDTAVVTFVAFESVEAMEAAYDAARQYARIFGSVIPDRTCATGGYDGIWTLGDLEAGRLICYEFGGDALVVWSYPDTRILSMIRQEDGDHAAAQELWLAAGPL